MATKPPVTAAAADDRVQPINPEVQGEFHHGMLRTESSGLQSSADGHHGRTEPQQSPPGPSAFRAGLRMPTAPKASGVAEHRSSGASPTPRGRAMLRRYVERNGAIVRGPASGTQYRFTGAKPGAKHRRARCRRADAQRPVRTGVATGTAPTTWRLGIAYCRRCCGRMLDPYACQCCPR